MLTLYKFELRKIISRKIVWITGGVLLVGLVIWSIASAVLPQNREYSDSSLNGYAANRAEQEAAEQDVYKRQLSHHSEPPDRDVL